jgi:hypothetical protein
MVGAENRHRCFEQFWTFSSVQLGLSTQPAEPHPTSMHSMGGWSNIRHPVDLLCTAVDLDLLKWISPNMAVNVLAKKYLSLCRVL